MAQRTCSVDGCDRPHSGRGYCANHYPLFKKPPARHSWAPRASNQSARPRHSLNHEYFDDISTEEQAYWLGFIAADGSVIRSKGTYFLRVELAGVDKQHIERLRDAIGSSKEVKPTRRGCVGIPFDSWRLIESLERVGITPRKSATVQPWSGPADLMPHYWRGLFDGDGSIYRSSNGWYLSFIGSRSCVREFSLWAKGICGSRAAMRESVADMWTWVVGGRAMPLRLADAMYSQSIVHLDRKYHRYLKLASIDPVEAHEESNRKRSASMRAAWRNGTHARARIRLERG